MTNTLRLPPTLRSSLVVWISWAPARFGSSRCLANNASVLPGWFCTDAARRLIGLTVMDSDTCALYTQEVETPDHLLVDCVYNRETWFRILRQTLLQDLAPDHPQNLSTWWCSARKLVAKARRKGFQCLRLVGCLVDLEGTQQACSL
jgi:hypothetical protein